MLTFKRALLLLALALFFALKVVAQNSLGDPVLYVDFGHGDNYTPVGPSLNPLYTTMDAGGGDRCPAPGRYLILNSSANCYGDTFKPVSFDHSGTNPFGYLMMVNGDNKPVIYYTYQIKGDKFCAGAKYQFAVFLNNINTQMPRPAGYVDADVRLTVKSANGTLLNENVTGPVNDGFKQYYVDFIAPADGSDVIISLNNNALTGTIGNDFAMDDITVKAYGPVIDIGVGTVAGPEAINEIQCLDAGQAKYYLKAFVHNYAGQAYQWQYNNNNEGWKNFDGKTQNHLDLETQFLTPQPGKYQYRLGINLSGALQNCQTFSEPITINVFKNPTFSLPPVTSFCQGDILTLTAGGGSDYLWTKPDLTTSTDHYLTVTTSADKSYEGFYTVRVMENGCYKESTTQVVVGEPLVVTVDNPDPVTCEGQPIQIGANGGTIGITYKWTPSTGLDHDDVAKPMANPKVTTEYNVLVSNGSCVKPQTVTVHVLALPTANAGADFTMQETVPVKLQGNVTGGDINFYWTPNEYIDDPTSLTPIINPPDNRTYTLHVESALCGSVADEVNVRVLKKITIPTTFTPNGDGVNDTWDIDKLITYPESTLTVYTRDGHEVFKTTGDAKHWNGVYAGKALPVGVYYYVIDLKNNLPVRAGWVMLVK